MPSELRTRILLLLPEPKNLGQFYLVDKVITGLVRLCGGATVSAHLPAAFHGFWVDNADNTVGNDNLMILADSPRAPSNLNTYLDMVKQRSQMDFDEDVIWVTTHVVERINTDDYVK